MSDYKYFAFISYNSHDVKWGKRLQHKLEQYGEMYSPGKTVFFAPYDIQPGGLTEELQERLRQSQHLIVICSPHSAQSPWVGKEIELFYNLGRSKNIHFFIVEGIPHSGDPATECIHPVVQQLGMPEILGANINEKVYPSRIQNRERAYVQLISKLLGIEFDAIWQRNKRQRRLKNLIRALVILFVICIIIMVRLANQPVDITLQLNEVSVHNNNLPPIKEAVVTININKETKTVVVKSLDSKLLFPNVHPSFLGHQAHCTVKCNDYINVDTTMILEDNNVINIKRDPSVYGHIHFRLWDPDNERFISNTEIYIDDNKVKSDENGIVDLLIPLEEQKPVYTIRAPFPVRNNLIIMPSGDSDIVSKK